MRDEDTQRNIRDTHRVSREKPTKCFCVPGLESSVEIRRARIFGRRAGKPAAATSNNSFVDVPDGCCSWFFAHAEFGQQAGNSGRSSTGPGSQYHVIGVGVYFARVSWFGHCCFTRCAYKRKGPARFMLFVPTVAWNRTTEASSSGGGRPSQLRILRTRLGKLLTLQHVPFRKLSASQIGSRAMFFTFPEFHTPSSFHGIRHYGNFQTRGKELGWPGTEFLGSGIYALSTIIA